MLLTNDFTSDPRVNKEALTLVNAGIDVIILAWDRKQTSPKVETTESGIKIIRLGPLAQTGKGLFNIFKLMGFWQNIIKQTHQMKFEVIHCHDFDTLPIGWWLSRKYKSKLIYDAHEPEYGSRIPILHYLINVIEKLLAKQADYIIVANYPTIVKFYTLNKKVAHVGNYYPLPEQPVKPVQDRINFVWVGPIRNDVLWQEMIGAFRELHQELKHAKLLIYGNPVNALAKDFIHYLIENSSGIELCAPVPFTQMKSVWENTDIALLTYNIDDRNKHTTSNKLFEAMAYGIPIIVTPYKEDTRIISESNCGLIVDPNTDGIYNGMKQLAMSFELRQRLGYNGRITAEDKYHWEIAADKLLGVYTGFVN
jgi:glycosyltransferase involved in cell wall biosynthesis